MAILYSYYGYSDNVLFVLVGGAGNRTSARGSQLSIATPPTSDGIRLSRRWQTARGIGTGAPMKVQQELMRDAMVQSTMNVYGQAMLHRKRSSSTGNRARHGQLRSRYTTRPLLKARLC